MDVNFDINRIREQKVKLEVAEGVKIRRTGPKRGESQPYEQNMEEIHRETLRHCQSMIVKDLLPEFELWDLLYEKDVLTREIMECIQAKNTRQEKTRQTLELLPTRGKGAYDSFIECLKHSNHSDLANSILEKEARLREQSESDLTDVTCIDLNEELPCRDEPNVSVLYNRSEKYTDDDPFQQNRSSASASDVKNYIQEPIMATSRKLIDIPVVIKPKLTGDCGAVLEALCDIDKAAKFICEKEKSNDLCIIGFNTPQSGDSITWNFHVDSTESVKFLKDLINSPRFIGHLKQFLKKKKMTMQVNFEIETGEETFIYCENHFTRFENSDPTRQGKIFYLYVKEGKLTTLNSVSIRFQNFTKKLKRCNSDKAFLEHFTNISKANESHERKNLEYLWYTVVPVLDSTNYCYTIESHDILHGTITTVEKQNISETYCDRSVPEFDVFDDKDRNDALVAFSLLILYTFNRFSIDWGFSMIMRMEIQKTGEKQRNRLSWIINDIFRYHWNDAYFCMIVIAMLCFVPNKLERNSALILLKTCKLVGSSIRIPTGLAEEYATCLIDLYQKVFSEVEQSFIQFLVYTYPLLNESQEVEILNKRFPKPRSPLTHETNDIENVVKHICSRVESDVAKPEWQNILSHLFQYLQINMDTVFHCLGLLNMSSLQSIKEKMVKECESLISAAKEDRNLAILPQLLNTINESDRSRLYTLIRSVCVECMSEGCDESEENLNALKALCIDFGFLRDQDFRQKILRGLASSTQGMYHSCLLTILGNQKAACDDNDLTQEIICTCFESVIKSLQKDKKIDYMYSFLNSVFNFVSTINESETLQEKLKKTAFEELRRRDMDAIIYLVISKDQIGNNRVENILCANVKDWMASQPKTEIQKFFKKLCDGETMKIHNSYQANIVIVCMEVSGLSTDGSQEKAMQEILDHQQLWKFILKYDGEYESYILGHPLAIKAKETILQSRKLILSNEFTFSLILFLCNQESINSWIQLYRCIADEDELESVLMNLSGSLNHTLKDTEEILRELRNIEAKSSNGSTLSCIFSIVLRLTQKCIKMFKNNEIPYRIIEYLRKHIPDHETTLLARKLLSSEIFCLTNMRFISEFKFKFDSTNFLRRVGNSSSQAPCFAEITQELSQPDFSEDKINSANVMEVISSFERQYTEVHTFVQDVADKKAYYLNTWNPIIEGRDVVLGVVDLLCCANYHAELALARDILQMPFDNNSSQALESFSSFHKHEEDAVLLCELLEVFSKIVSQENRPVFLDSVAMMLSSDIMNVTLSKIKEMLVDIYAFTSSLTTNMRRLISVLKKSQNVINFVQETIDEDIRNLINAVEYSDQHINESIVSAFIQVHEFLSQLLASHKSGNFETFIEELQKCSKIDEIETKIQNCCDNLYSLQMLRENLVSRTEMTKETVARIVQKGNFHFRFCEKQCKVEVSYRDKFGTVTQDHSKLADIRSKALLIMNTSTGGDVAFNEDRFKNFVSIADIAFHICDLYTDLHKTGYDDDPSLSVSVEALQLREHFERLQNITSDWDRSLQNCRENHYYMNFIFGNQIQSLMRYFSGKDFEHDVPPVLKYINPKISLDYIRSLQWLKDEGEITTVENLAAVLDKLFDGNLNECRNEETGKDSEHHQKQIYFARLDAESRYILHTLLTLFHRVTGALPEANQVILCCEETSWEEVYNLLERFRHKPNAKNKQLYCIACTDLLSVDIQSRLMNYMEKVTRVKTTHSLAIIHCGSELTSIVKYFESYMTDMTQLNKKEMDAYMNNLFSDVFVVCSKSPGLGKTEMVFEEAARKNKNVVTMHISGPIQKTIAVENLCRLPLHHHSLLHIDIGKVDNVSILDIFLFELLALRYVSVQSNCFYLPRNIPVGVEIACIENQNLITPTFCRTMYLNADIMSRLKISKEPTSDLQVVCNYLCRLDTEKLDNEDISFSETTVLHAERCKSVLKKHCNAMENASFTRVNTYLSVFADQLKRLTTSRYFKKDQLDDMFGSENKVKSKMVQALEYISQLFAKSNCLSNSGNTRFRENPLDSNETAVNRMHGMIQWEDDQQLLMLFNNKDKQTFSILYKEIDHVPEEIRSLFKDQNICLPQNLISMTHLQLQELLVKIARSAQTPVLPGILDKLFKQYVLTPDNLLKMLLVLLRIQSSVPIVVMGETGCGKTSLVTYLACICGVEFMVVNIHPGVRASDIESKVKALNDKALKNLDLHYWMFFDEVNTSNHIGFLSEILCHHKCCGDALAPNIVFVAACNPYKQRNHDNVLTAGLRVPYIPDILSYLVYRVHPLPETMMDYVWDFGSLSDTDEKEYISKMVSFLDENDQWKSDNTREIIVDLLSKSQSYVRETELVDSCVSLRDVKRCIHLIWWFQNVYLQKKEGDHTNVTVTAIILAVSVCYYCRFKHLKSRSGYLKVLENTLKRNRLQGYHTVDVLNVLRTEQEYILNNMDVPAGIAKNTCLLENVFIILVAVLNKIPLFLVGKPGCSKSLSMELITSNMRGKKSKNKFFLNFPELYPVSFQGSEASTSEGIQNVFAKAKFYQDHNAEVNVLSLVVLDEVGLADASRWNPLKVLHSLLEPEGENFCNVAVIGISNYALDAAKMNRAIHLSRVDMEEDELISTGSSILTDICKDNYEHLRQVEPGALSALAKAYIEYVNIQETPNFIGLRDFYALIKFIGRTLSIPQHAAPQDFKIATMKGVLRNFGGSEPTEACNVFRKHLGVSYNVTSSVELLIKENILDKECRHLMIIADGESILRRLYEILNENNKQCVTIFGSHFIDDQTVDANYRILSQIILCMEQGKTLILKDLESIYGSLYDMLNQNYSTFDNKNYCRIALGSVVSPLCLVHEDFKCIVLIEDEKVQASDPPFLNRFEKQKWVLQDALDDEQSQILRILSSEFENMWRMFEESDKNNPFDIAPMFGEEFLPSLSVKLSKTLTLTEGNPKDILALFSSEIKWIAKPESIIRLQSACKSNKYKGAIDLKQLLQNYFAAPLHSGLVSVTKDLSMSGESKNETLMMCSADHQTNIFSTKEGKLSDATAGLEKHLVDINPTYNTSIQEGHKIENPFTKKDFLKLMIFSNSPCLCPSTRSEFSCHMLSEVKSRKQFENIVKTFWLSEDKGVLVIQCDTYQNMRNIHLVKSIMDDYQKQYIREQFEIYKHMCLVFHLHRNKPDVLRNKFGFLTDWKMITLDSLKEPLKSLPTMYNRSIGSIITERQYFLNKCIESNILWAISRIQYGNMISRPPGWMMQTVEKVTSDSILMKAYNLFLSKFIKEKMPEDNWIDDVAFDVCKLATASNFVSALESRLNDTVKELLAMLVYRLEELSTFTIANNTESSESKLYAWTRHLHNHEIVSLKDIGLPTGPCCFVIGERVLDMHAPFSKYFINKVESFRRIFIDSLEEQSTANSFGNNENTDKQLEGIVQNFTCRVEKEVEAFLINSYDGIKEDYIHDFCLYVCSLQTCMLEEDEKVVATKFAISQLPNASIKFSEVDELTLCDIVTRCHTTFWLHTDDIMDFLKVLQLMKLMGLDVMNSIGNIDPLSKSIDALVEQVFGNLHNLPDEKLNLSSWQQEMNGIFTLIEQVTEMQLIHGLRFCHELLTLFTLPYKQDTECVMHMIKYISAGNSFSSRKMFEMVWNMIKTIQLTSDSVVSDHVLQNTISLYVNRCLSCLDDNIPEPVVCLLERIEKRDLFDKTLTYFQPVLTFALQQYCHEDDFEAIVNSEKECIDVTEGNELLRHISRCLESSQELVTPFSMVLVNALQKITFQNILRSDFLKSCQSDSDIVIVLAHLSKKALCRSKIKLRKIVSTAFLKLFINKLIQENRASLQNKTVLKCMKEILLSNDQGDIPEHLLHFLIRNVENDEETINLQKTVNDMELGFKIHLNPQNLERSFDARPLASFYGGSDPCDEEKIMESLENIGQMQKLMASENGSMKFWMYHIWICLGENTLYNIMSEDVCKFTKTFEIFNSATLRFQSCLLGKDVFGIKTLDLTSDITMQKLQAASFILQLSCVCIGHCSEGSFWNSLVLSPTSVKDAIISLENSVASPFGHYVANQAMSCRLNHRFVSTTGRCCICEEKYIYQKSTRKEKSEGIGKVKISRIFFVSKKILSLMLKSGMTMAVALRTVKESELLKMFSQESQDDALRILDTSIKHIWNELLKMLQVNSKTLGRILQTLLCQLKDELREVNLNKDNIQIWEAEISEKIDSVLSSKEKMLQKQMSLHKQAVHMGETDAEFLITGAKVQKDYPNSHDLFGNLVSPSPLNLYATLVLSKMDLCFPFLCLVLDNMNALKLPQCITHIVKWHATVSSICKFRVSRVDSRKQVENFIARLGESEQNPIRKSLQSLKKQLENINKVLLRDSNLKRKFPEIKELLNPDKMEDLLMFGMESNLYVLLRNIVAVQNSFIDAALNIAAFTGCLNISFLKKHENAFAVYGIHVIDAKPDDLINNDSMDDILQFSQNGIRNIDSMNIRYDFGKIENSLALKLLYGKPYLVLPHSPLRVVFRDEQFENSVCMLREIDNIITQTTLNEGTRKYILAEIETKQTIALDLLIITGISLAIIMDIGGNPDMSLLVFLERWKEKFLHLQECTSFLKSMEVNICLRHVVGFYKFLEEINGNIETEALKEDYKDELSEEQTRFIVHNMDKHTQDHLLQALKIFIHRCLNGKNDLNPNLSLSKCLPNHDVWYDECISCTKNLKEETMAVLSKLGLCVGHMFCLVHLLKEKDKDLRVDAKHPKQTFAFGKGRKKKYM